MKYFSDKLAKKKRILADLRRQRVEEIGEVCENCGRSRNMHLDYSHTLSQKRRPDLITDPRNGLLVCRTPCHHWIEAGYWPWLKIGSQIAEYVLEMDEEYYYEKMYKARQNMVFFGNHLLNEEQIKQKLDELNPGFKSIGWAPLTLEEMMGLNLIIDLGNGYKLAA